MGEQERVLNFLSQNWPIGWDIQALRDGAQVVHISGKEHYRLVQQAGAAGLSISALKDAINPDVLRIFGRTMKPKWLTRYLEQLRSTFVLEMCDELHDVRGHLLKVKSIFVRLTSGALASEGKGEQRAQPPIAPSAMMPMWQMSLPITSAACVSRSARVPAPAGSPVIRCQAPSASSASELISARATCASSAPKQRTTPTVTVPPSPRAPSPRAAVAPPIDKTPPKTPPKVPFDSALLGSTECGAADCGTAVYEQGYTDGWYAGHQAAAEDIWRNAECARVQLQKELDEAHEVERTKLVETMKQHYRQALAMQVGQGVKARVAREARMASEQHPQHSSVPSAPSESLMKAAAAAADAAAVAAIAAADVPKASFDMLSAAARATGKRQLGLGLDAAATPCIEDLGQSTGVTSSCGELLTLAVTAQRFALGCDVYVKRSNGEECIAFVKEYDAAKMVYTVELEQAGSGKTKQCREDIMREGPLCGTASFEESVTNAPPGASAGSAGKGASTAHYGAFTVSARQSLKRPRDNSEEPRHSSTAAQTHTTVPSPTTERAAACGRSVAVGPASDYGPSPLDEERNQHAIRDASIPSLLAPAPVTLTLALTRRLLAFRQYLEMRRLCVGVKSNTKPWQLRVRRPPFLVADVLEHFGSGQRREKPERVLKQLYSLTSVTFIDPRTGLEEEGDDLGGLTRELYSLFWREVLREEHGLFERAVGNDSPGGCLPRPSAPPEALEAVGRVLLKCIIDDHPIGHGVCPFVLDQLVHGDAGAALELGSPASALSALARFDASLAESWRQLLEVPEHVAGLTYEDFDPDAPDIYVPPAAVGEAIRMGVTQRLLTSRAGAFAALRRGAHSAEDLTVQLATVGSSDELSFLLQGKREVSAHELLECFTLPRTSVHEEAAAGFAAVGSEVPSYFEALLLDETVFGPEERLTLLRWCTGSTECR